MGKTSEAIPADERKAEVHMNGNEELLSRYRAIQALAISMNETEDVEELFTLMLSQCAELTRAEYGAVLLPDREGKALRAEVVYGIERKAAAEISFPIGQGVSGSVFKGGAPRLLSDVSLEPGYLPIAEGVRTELAVPMAHAGRILGVLRLDAKRENAFTEEDIGLLTTIAGHAAQMLLRTGLKSDLERRIKLKDMLIAITGSIDTGFDLKGAFESVMRHLADDFGIIRGFLVLFDESDPMELSVHAGYNYTDEELARGVYKPGEGIVGRALELGKPVSVPDIRKEKDFLNRMQVKRRKDIPISFIAVPIKLEGVVAGVIAVEKAFESEAILREEEEMIVLVASLIGNKVRAVQQLAHEREQLLEENETLRTELSRQTGDAEFVCKNRKMLELVDLARLVAGSSSSIMILGESGTGKEMVARFIHRNSARREAPFVSVNCAAIPENLLESEFFGYKKGAFTGAVADKKGKFQLANGGTLFLDEIGDMPSHLQVKLLRAIQDRAVEPVGGEKKEPVDIRILSATNRDLSKLIAEGKFRDDLYYRLNVVELKIPPLRDRPEDIPSLVQHFLARFSDQMGRKIAGISPTALRILQTHSWPGNVRELENVMERAVILCPSGLIEPAHLPPQLYQGTDSHADSQTMGRWVSATLKGIVEDGKAWDEVIGSAEKELIKQALLLKKRNKLRTADFLGINRNTLRAKMDLYGIE